MRMYFRIGCQLILALTLAAPALAQTLETQSITVSAETYAIARDARGQQPSVNGFGRLMTPGQPQLPSRIFAIAIPPGATVIDVTYAGDSRTLPGTFTIAPAPLPRVIGPEDPAVTAQHKQMYEQNYVAVYARDDAFPASPVELVRTAGYREYNLVDVRVTPFAYQPASGALTHYPQLTVYVRYRPAAAAPDAAASKSGRIDRVARQIVSNYDTARAWYRDNPQKRGLHDFVIITLDSLTSAVTPLVNWETLKGRNVQVVTTTWINSNYTGYDTPEKIRNFLRDKYPAGQWGIEDVLIVGHRNNLPMRRISQNLGYGKPETDFYYAELSLPDSQSWDADADHAWGEDTDPIEFYSEVNVGRIPWSDPNTVLSICNKSVAYEQDNAASFKKNMLLLGGFFWEDTDNAVLMETKINQPWMADWTFTRLYEHNSTVNSTYTSDYELTHSNVMAVWPAGTYAFVNWAGHGSPTSAHIMGYGSAAFIQSSDCSSLNDNYPAIIFADACSNSDTDSTNLGQSMLKRGAVGFVGATKVALGRGAWGGAYDGSSQSMDYFFTTYVTSGEYTQGAAHQAALRQMYTYGLWSYMTYEMCEWGALWGNPDLSMAPPTPLFISVPEAPPAYMLPGVVMPITVEIRRGVEAVSPESATLHYRYNGGVWQTSPLVHDGGDLYIGTLPPAVCGQNPEFYFSAAGDGGSTVYAPEDAPTSLYSIIVGSRTAFIQWNFDTDPGWTCEPLWAFGQPTGYAGAHGGPDPNSGYTGTNVYGYSLTGTYENNLPEKNLTSTAIDCTGQYGVHLSFWRWLGVSLAPYDQAYVRASNDGMTWTTIWQNTAEVADTSWHPIELDISGVADDQPTVYLRWTMGPTDNTWRYCGWNIDDVALTSFECVPLWSPGDTNCDGTISYGDINPFVVALQGSSTYEAQYPGCRWLNADVNGDGTVSYGDINAFVQLLAK